MLLKKYQPVSISFILLALAYIAFTVLLPPDKATLHKYHLSTTQDIVIVLLIAIPYVIIWFIALIGYLRLKYYSDSIKDSKDGVAFNKICKGIFLLSLWLPVSAVVTAATQGIYHAHPSTTSLMIILANYINILILLPAFTFIYVGSRKLLKVIKKPEYTLPQWLYIAYIGFSALYVFLVLSDPSRQHPSHSVSVASYYMPDWLIVTTIVIPRLVTWFIGIQAIHNIYLYRMKVKGSIYKKALANLASGIAWVIITLIVLRGFQSISGPLLHFSLGIILLIVYLLLILIASGYFMIMKGSRNLQRIEET